MLPTFWQQIFNNEDHPVVVDKASNRTTGDLPVCHVFQSSRASEDCKLKTGGKVFWILPISTLHFNKSVFVSLRKFRTKKSDFYYICFWNPEETIFFLTTSRLFRSSILLPDQFQVWCPCYLHNVKRVRLLIFNNLILLLFSAIFHKSYHYETYMRVY